MTNNYWNKFASSYSSYQEQRMFNTAQNMLINFDYTPDNLKILDAGCGSGMGTNHILAQVKSDAEVNAVDFADEMIAIASSRPISNRVKFQVMDTTKLSFPNDYFDIYTSNMVMMILDTPEDMIKEAYRVLKKGKVACFSVWGREENSLGIILPKQCFEEVCKKHGLDKGNPNSTGRSNFVLNDIEKVSKMFKDNGFEVIKTYYNLNKFETWNLNRYVDSSLNSPAYQGLKDEHPAVYEEMVDMFTARAIDAFSEDKHPALESLVYVVRKDII